jgi:hypothetical protein
MARKRPRTPKPQKNAFSRHMSVVGMSVCEHIYIAILIPGAPQQQSPQHEQKYSTASERE